MANYTLHLGFNWSSPTIGSIWSSGAALEDYRFLQYALAGSSGLPAWFQFQVNDVLNIEIWDLSSAPGKSEAVPGLNMSFAPLDAGTTGTYDPSTLMDLQGNASVATQLVNGQSQAYLSFNNVVSASGTNSPWGPCRGHYSTGSVAFKSEASYKLSFYLRVALSGGSSGPRSFLSDPEVIVGSRG